MPVKRYLRGPRNPTWTESEDALLRQYHSEGKTFAQIGLIVGRTENACACRAHVMGLPRRWQDTWTAEGLVGKIESLWRSGQTSSYIAKEIGISRGALMGKLSRLGLLGKRPKHRASPQARLQRKWEYQRNYQQQRRQPPKQRAVAPSSPLLPSLNIPFLETTRTQCRYMQTDERVCCGQETWGESYYCAAHWRICHEVRR